MEGYPPLVLALEPLPKSIPAEVRRLLLGCPGPGPPITTDWRRDGRRYAALDAHMVFEHFYGQGFYKANNGRL
jgi:hypothetical protein